MEVFDYVKREEKTLMVANLLAHMDTVIELLPAPLLRRLHFGYYHKQIIKKKEAVFVFLKEKQETKDAKPAAKEYARSEEEQSPVREEEQSPVRALYVERPKKSWGRKRGPPDTSEGEQQPRPISRDGRS
jgi:hypothetical protein